MRFLFGDTETFSECDLKKAGTHRYAADPSTEVIVWQWALDGAEPVVEDLTGRKMPSAESLALLNDPDVMLVFHNAAFDRAVIREVWGLDIPPERWFCTMVQAMAHGLPGSLDKLSTILGLEADEAKDKRGRELIMLLCKPRPKGHKLRRATSATHPNEWAEFLEYSRMDIVAMRAVHRRLPRWNYAPGHPELALWHLDQHVNDRGFMVDVDLAHAAIDAVADEQTRLKAEIDGATDGAVTNASQRDELLSYILLEHGVSLPDMRADTLERRARDPELPEAVRRLIEIRLEATKTSTAKYRALVNAVSADGRLRNTMQFCGAQRTGRVAHRLFQPGNMPRPSPGFDGEAQDQAIAALKAGVADIAFDNVMRLTSDCIRGTIIAPPGRKLCIADLSNIEGRVLAFLASEQWKLEAFRAFDRGEGADIYKLAYAKSFGTSPDKVDKQQRQIGKVQELMLGYEGGVGAYLTGAATYGFDVADLAVAVKNATPADTWAKTLDSFDWFKKKGLTYSLPVEHWAACRVLVDSWREAHAKTKELWHGLKDAYAAAVRHPGETFSAGRWLRVRRDGAWLRIRLPSGRYLCYLQPEVDDSGQCSYMGINQYTRQWARIKTHGGKLAENVTQAVARDVLFANMMQIEVAGYAILVSIHDELLTETPDTDAYSSATLAELMSTVPDWAPGLPLAAAGFETTRYRKD
jgi:DNA polymerase